MAFKVQNWEGTSSEMLEGCGQSQGQFTHCKILVYCVKQTISGSPRLTHALFSLQLARKGRKACKLPLCDVSSSSQCPMELQLAQFAKSCYLCEDRFANQSPEPLDRVVKPSLNTWFKVVMSSPNKLESSVMSKLNLRVYRWMYCDNSVEDKALHEYSSGRGAHTPPPHTHKIYSVAKLRC